MHNKPWLKPKHLKRGRCVTDLSLVPNPEPEKSVHEEDIDGEGDGDEDESVGEEDEWLNH